MGRVSISSYLIFFSIYQTKYVVDVINFKSFLGSTSKAMADGKKEGKVKIQRFELNISIERSFLDEKNFFSWF